MTYVLALVAGIVGSALGWIVAAAVTVLIAGQLGMSDFEGERGMTAIFGIGPIGGLVGLIAGVVVTLRWRGRHSAAGIAWRLPLVLVSIAAAVAGVLWWLYETRPLLNSNGPAPRILFELRLPPGVTPAAGRGVWSIVLHTEGGAATGVVVERPIRTEEGRQVLSGEVDVTYRSGWRLLEAKVPGQIDRLFHLRLPASPRRTTEFGGWERAQFVAEPDAPQPRKTGSEEGFEIRYRIVWPQ